MSAAIPLVKLVQVDILIETGSLKGQSFTIKQGQLSIGREAGNDIVFEDDAKMSRKHAQIFYENSVPMIKNLSQKNPIWLDGKEVDVAPLQKSAKLQVGSTVLQLRVSVNTMPVKMPTAPPPPPAHLKVAPAAEVVQRPFMTAPKASEFAMGAPQAPQSSRQSPPQRTMSMDSKKANFYIIVGIVAVAFVWLMSSGSGSKKKESQLRTRDQVLMDLEKSETAIKEIEKKQESAGQQTLQYKTAQEHYIKGFRDYRQGQFARAMSSFQAALSFYPQHELAKKYLTLSRRKFDENVQFNMIQGKRYKGKNNFRLCKSAYANVMIMVKDPNDAIYREAKQYYNECSLLFEAKY